MYRNDYYHNDNGYENDEDFVPELLKQAESRPFGDGLNWINQAWQIVKMRFGTWLLISFAFMLCALGTYLLSDLIQSFFGNNNIINLTLGGLISTLVYNIGIIVLSAGLVYAVDSLVVSDTLEVSDLFAGFQYKFKELCILTVFSLIGTFLIFGVLFMMVAMNGGIIWAMSNIKTLVWIGGILYFAMMLAGWLTLPLIMLHDVSAWQAIKMSFSAGIRNIMPMICYGVVIILVMMGVGFAIAFILGLLIPQTSPSMQLFVIMPTFMILGLIFVVFNTASLYATYRNIWTDLPLE